MKRSAQIILLWTFLSLAATVGAIAGDAVIWGTSGYGRVLPTTGLELSSSAGLKQYRNLTVDPTAGAGVAAPVGSIGVRDNAGAGEGWFKVGAANTAWSNFLTGASGWGLTGNAGTNAAANFLGTTDAIDLVLRTDNTERFRLTQGADPDLTLSSIEMFSNGNVGAVASSFNSFNMDHTFTSTIANNFFGPYIASNFQGAVSGGYFGFTDNPVWESGSSSGSLTSFQANPDIQSGSTPGNVSVLSANPNVAAGTMVGNTYNGVSIGGIHASNMAGFSAYQMNPTISATTGYYNGVSDFSQWSATSVMSTNSKFFSAQPSMATGSTFTSGVGYFSGAQVASGVTINDWTDFQASTDIDSAVANYNGLSINPQGSGNATSVNLAALSPNLSGDNATVNGLTVNGSIGDDITTYVGVNLSPSATGTVGSVTGVSVDNSLLTTTTPKAGISTNQGSANIQAYYSTADYGGGTGVGALNFIGGTFDVDSGSPVTGGGAMIANNLATVQNFNDDMPVDVTGGLVGYTYVGFVSQTNIAAGKTVDHINAALAGAGVSATSGGGALTTADMYSAAGFLNQGGTIDVTGEMRGLHLTSNLCNFVSGQCFGVKEEAGARNYFLGGVELATSGAQPACSATIRGTLWVVQGGVGVADDYQICQKDSSNVYSWISVGSGALSNYLYKPGLSGGQTATGGTGASDNLVLRSTTNGTKGQVYLDETTASTSPTTGALRVDGGVGVGGAVVAAGSLRSNTSLVLEDPGAGTNTTTIQAGTVSSSYTVTLPAAQGAANTTLVNDGAGALSWTSLVPQQFGTRQTGRSIVAGTGITSGASHMSTTAIRQTVYVVGNGSAPADISASPQIEAGTIIGQEMELCGTDDTAYVLLEQDNNLAINGAAELTKDRCLTLVWRGTDGTNSAWGEKARNF